MLNGCQGVSGYDGSLGESFAEAGLHLNHHYGASFGLGIMPLSFIIFLAAMLYLAFKKNETANQGTTPNFDKNIARLEELMKNQRRGQKP